jgi:hypothetical protein
VTIVRDEFAPAPAAAEALAAVPSAPHEAPLEWTLHPWRARPAVAALALLVVAAATFEIARFELPALARLGLALAFTWMLAPALLPTRYRLDGRGVASRMVLLWDRRAWSVFKRASIAAAARVPLVRLSTLERPGPLDAFRGMTLLLPPRTPERDRLLDEIRRRLAQHGL